MLFLHCHPVFKLHGYESTMAENNYSNVVLMDLFIIYGQCNKNISRTCREFNEKYADLPRMNLRKFIRLKRNFEMFGSSLKGTRNLPRLVTDNEDNAINVLAYFHGNPQASIRSAVHDLGVKLSSVHRILKEHGMHDYKFHKVQALKPQDAQQRIELCEMLMVRTQVDEDFLKKIIWTDESKFSREGIFNRRNLHYWATENPHVTREMGFQEKFSFNVFCLIMDNQLRFLIYDENLDSGKYLNILRTTVGDFIEELTLEQYRTCWYQLDGAPAHCTAEVGLELDRIFDDRWIRRLGPWNWPPRSPDLTPLDFYLWGTIKQRVYRTPVNTREELEHRVTQAFQELDPNEIQRATIDAVDVRLRKCLETNGKHFEHLLK